MPYSIYKRRLLTRFFLAGRGKNEQSELKRAFQLALVLADSEPRINVTVSIKGKLQQGLRRYTFVYSKDSPKTVQIELCSRDSELASRVGTLAADIERLNTLAVPEHTVPAATVPADDKTAQPDELPLQQLDLNMA